MLKKEIADFSRADIVYFVLIGLILLMIAGVFVIDASRSRTEADAIIEEIHESSKENELFRFTAQTQLTLIRNYTQSGGSYITSEALGDTFVGKQIEDVLAAYTGWDVVSFDESEITLKCNVESFGPEYYKITSVNYNGEELVAVYESDIDGNETMYLQTSCYVSLLDEAQQAALRAGIFVKGDNALKAHMENYIE